MWVMVALFFASCGENRPENVTVKILATTDVHGALFPYDFVNKRATNFSLAQVCGYVEQERANTNQHVLLLDNGDILQGQPVVYYSNFEDTTQQHICARAMNFMQYDAATIGNHDIEPGHEVYDKVRREFQFPWLAANAVKNSDGKPYFTPYTVVNKGGIKIAILGLITPAIPQWLPENIWSGMHFDPMVESANKWLKVIQEKEQPDLVVGLFHSGLGNGEKQKKGVTEQASKLVAKSVSGLDMIICGHDHQEFMNWVKNPEGKEVLIINPNNSTRKLAEVEVKFRLMKDCKSYQKEFTPKLLDGTKLPVSKQFMAEFAGDYDTVKKYVDKEIGSFKHSVSIPDAMFGDAAFIDLIHQAQLEISNADISFAAPLSFNATIKAGAITVGDLFKLYRYENLLYTMNLSGKEIKDFLEYTIDLWFAKVNNSDNHLIKLRKRGDRWFTQTPFFSFDTAAGIDYDVDLTKPLGERVTIKKMSNGNAFSEAKMYSVAVNSYRGNGGGGHLTKGAGIAKKELANRIQKSTTKDMRYFIMKWIEQKQVVTPHCDNNWTIAPKKWWEKAKKVDYELLYPTRK
ncbi:bifunctional metallophosphatase/5'-nucleotidase [Prolixibacteraceae bacterium JC049]|nr:bifunctional metallophosphatase/5'-nucleotidase [Prolixibacteraceae bacterium JC049]